MERGNHARGCAQYDLVGSSECAFDDGLVGKACGSSKLP